MRKLFLSLIALTLGIGAWANEIYYTATSKLNFITNAFDVQVKNHSFDENTGKGTITFDGEVETIGYRAFSDCRNLTSIVLPNTIKTIESNAFMSCSNLMSITIPYSVTSIGEYAFGNCICLRLITFAGAACQNAISNTAFANSRNPTLNLPNDWDYAKAPTTNNETWNGVFILYSNLYSNQEETDKQNAIAEVTNTLNSYPSSYDYLQPLYEQEVEKINNAANRQEVNEKKQTAIAILESAILVYNTAFAKGQADAFGPLGEEHSGPAVKVTKGDKEVILYLPDKVEYIIRK